MNYFEAQKILDKVKEGEQYPQWIINQALELTGDIDEPVLPNECFTSGNRPATGRATSFFGPRSDPNEGQGQS